MQACGGACGRRNHVKQCREGIGGSKFDENNKPNCSCQAVRMMTVMIGVTSSSSCDMRRMHCASATALSTKAHTQQQTSPSMREDLRAQEAEEAARTISIMGRTTSPCGLSSRLPAPARTHEGLHTTVLTGAQSMSYDEGVQPADP